MVFDLLPSLHLRSTRATVCVRVSRKWEYRGGSDDGPIQHVDLVLIDAQGNSMYGEIPGSQVALHSPRIEENGIYVLTRFRVSNAKRSFRPVDGPFMIEFTCRTHVSAPRDGPSAFPMITYRLTPIDELKPLAGDTTNFVDVIGLLVERSDTHIVHLPNKPNPTLTRHFVLRDLNFSEIKVTLWGQRAADFNIDQMVNTDEAKPVVVLLVGTLMKKFQDKDYLSANTAARWYFNPEIPEAKPFYDSFQDQRIEIRHVLAPAHQPDQPRAPAQIETRSLLEMNAMDPYDFPEGGYRCTVAIARLVPNVSWWFASCSRCSKSCAVDGGGYRCNACPSTSFRFKYKLCFIAMDGTAEAEMICFGDVARHIVGKPVQQVLRTATSANPPPADIARIVSRRFTFFVTLTQQSYYREEKTYQVTSVVQTHAQPAPLPAPAPILAQDDDDAPPTGSGVQAVQNALGHSPSKTAANEKEMFSASPSDSAGSSLLINNTPPPTLNSTNTTPEKAHARPAKGSGGHPAARKKLILEGDDDEQIDLDISEDHGKDDLPEMSAKTMDDKIVVAVTKEVPLAKKRSPASYAAAQ